MKRNVILPIALTLLISLGIFVSAVPYDPDKIALQFDSLDEIYKSVLETEDGGRVTLYLLEFNKTGEQNRSIIVPYLGDEVGRDGYLADSIIRKDDISYEENFWGCLSGASFTDKFGAILGMLIGKRPISITAEEEQEFEIEGRKIANTPGTGAFNTKACYESCQADYENKIKVDGWGLRRILTPEDAAGMNKCMNDCTAEFSCGTSINWNSVTSDGYAGIKEMELSFAAEDKLEIFVLDLNINPETGELIDGEISLFDPIAGPSGYGKLEAKQGFNVIEESGNLNLGRFAYSAFEINEFDALYKK